MQQNTTALFPATIITMITRLIVMITGTNIITSITILLLLNTLCTYLL